MTDDMAVPSSDAPPPWFDDDMPAEGPDTHEREPTGPPTGFDAFFGTLDLPSSGGTGFLGEPAWQDDPAVRGLIPETGSAQAPPPAAGDDDAATAGTGPGLGTFVFVNGVATVVPLTRAEALAQGYAVVDYEDEPLDDEPLDDEPLGEEPLDDEPLGEEPLGEEPLGEEPSGDETVVVEDSAVEDSAVEDSAVEDSAVEEPLLEDTPVFESPVEDAPAPVEDAAPSVDDAVAPVAPADVGAPSGTDATSLLSWLRQLVPGAPLHDPRAEPSLGPHAPVGPAAGPAVDLRFATGPWADTPPAIDPNSPVIIRAVQLTRTFRRGPREVPVLRGVDLEVHQGEFVAITGASGSGKTTLLHCLAGLDDLSAGSVFVDGLELHALTDGERSRHRSAAMGFAFQTYNLVPSLSALENVELPLMLNDWPQVESRQEAQSALALVGLADRADFLPEELSGGEQQRVAIARAFVGEPKVLWADEPTGNLDDSTAAQILQVFRELNHAGLTIVMVTHDPAVARLAHRVVELAAGQIIQVSQQVA